MPFTPNTSCIKQARTGWMTRENGGPSKILGKSCPPSLLYFFCRRESTCTQHLARLSQVTWHNMLFTASCGKTRTQIGNNEVLVKWIKWWPCVWHKTWHLSRPSCINDISHLSEIANYEQTYTGVHCISMPELNWWYKVGPPLLHYTSLQQEGTGCMSKPTIHYVKL